MATTNDDKRLTAVTDEENKALDQNKSTFGDMVNDATGYYDRQADAVQEWADEQKKLQNEQTDFAIERVNQQKAQAKQDYTKEQSGAYVDWQKQSNQYGANAEKMASQGLAGTGYSESSQVSMYNTYQNRVATARESYNRAVLNYDNAIKEAQLQNNALLAEIAYEALQKQLELALTGFQYKNELITKQADRELQIKSLYQQKYQDVLSQINTENALAEEIRQYNESMAFQREQFEWQKEQANKSATISRSKSDNLNNSSNSSSQDTIKKDEIASGDMSAAEEYIEALIASGATKDDVAREIAIAATSGNITNKEAQALYAQYAPRGVEY